MSCPQYCAKAEEAAAFSLLMAVYSGDNPEHLSHALESVERSGIQPSEIVLVKDGPVSDALNEVLAAYSIRLPIRLVSLPENRGLGPALQIGLETCSYELIARFDSDDVLEADRFEHQLRHMANETGDSVVGGWIAEFDSDPACAQSIRRVPLSAEDVLKYSAMRNPMNHMTVMFRKSSVLAAGGYWDQPGYEDYGLWARMLKMGARLVNLPIVMVRARAGLAMIGRRGGWRYAKQEYALQAELRRLGAVGSLGFIRNLCLRVPPRLLTPKLRLLIYKHLLRKSRSTDE